MTRVLAHDFDSDRVSSLVEFLTAMSHGQIVQHGKSIEVTDLSNGRLKFLLHKFLHTNHLSNYGVLYTARAFEIVHIRPDAKPVEHETRKTRMPFVPIHPPPTAVEPSLAIQWRGKSRSKKRRDK